MLTYKSLYSLVVDEIKKKSIYPNTDSYNNQGNKSQVQSPVMMGAVGMNVSTADIMNAMMTLLEEIVPPRIKTGLTVYATSPKSDAVIIYAGEGTAGGKNFRSDKNVTITIPFDSTTTVFYINMYVDGFKVEKGTQPKKLPIAKIVVPEPGRTSYIKNNKADLDPWDAYIVNLKEYHIYGDEKGIFEEDTLELFRDNLNPILADNIVGNLRLSENLKITNTRGTLELDSERIMIKTPTGETLAKFDKYGTFYYNSEGLEVAKFSIDSAKIGNILVNTNSIQSLNYISDNRGFKIESGGYAEFQDVRIRGRISSSIFEYNKVSAVGGKLVVSNSSTLVTRVFSGDSTIVTDLDIFKLNDIIYIKVGFSEEYMLVTDISSAPTYGVTRDIGNFYDVHPQWEAGTAVISLGNSDGSGGFISLNSYGQYTPFIDIISRNSCVFNDYTTKVRLGNLEGISDSCFGGNLTGYGLWADNVYLRGCLSSSIICGSCIYGTTIQSSTFQTASSGARTVFDTEGIKSYSDSSGNPITFQVIDGSVVAKDIKLQDPSDECNYSYLDGGTLKFHDRLGYVPYVKRIMGGVINSGCTITLLGWTQEPYVQVGVNSLLSFNSANSAQSQRWCIYHDNMCYFCTGECCYGYCFQVHSLLVVDEGSGVECVKDINFGICTCTNTCVCETRVRNRFQLWCNNAAPSNYYYGVICYRVCYRKVGDTPWCYCSYCFEQPHGSTSELTTTFSQCKDIAFPCNGQWELQDSQVSIAYYDSGICATSCSICYYYCCTPYTVYCTYCTCREMQWGDLSLDLSCQTNTGLQCYCGCRRTPDNNVVHSIYFLCRGGSWTVCDTPANAIITCNCLRVCYYTSGCCFYFNTGSKFECVPAWFNRACGVNNNNPPGYVCVHWGLYFCACGLCFFARENSMLTCIQNCTCYECFRFSCTYDLGTNPVNYINAVMYAYGFACGNYSYNQNACSTMRICIASASLLQCYCVPITCYCCIQCCCIIISGDARTCEYKNLYTLQDTYGCYCSLDATGTVNWLAIGYS